MTRADKEITNEQPDRRTFRNYALTGMMLQGKGNNKNYMRILNYAILVFIIAILYCIIDPYHLIYGKLILNQKMSSKTYSDIMLQDILQELADASKYKISFSICPHLAKQHITLNLNNKTSLGNILRRKSASLPVVSLIYGDI